FANRLNRGLGAHGDRAQARQCLYPLTAYFLLRRAAERRDSRASLSRLLGRPATLADVARHIHAFAATILDRVFLLGGQLDRFAITVEGLPGLHAQLDQGRGVLLFGSHLGSFEVLRVIARQGTYCRHREVLDMGHNPAMTQLLVALSPGVAAGVFDAGQDGPPLMLAIKQAADEGALIALLVDRTQPGAATQEARFFGAPARFPVAPWLIAAGPELPVAMTFGPLPVRHPHELVLE